VDASLSLAVLIQQSVVDPNKITTIGHSEGSMITPRIAIDNATKVKNIVLMGVVAQASAKTLFFLGILECRKGVYFDGSNTTNRILDALEEERPRVICIDELDSGPSTSQLVTRSTSDRFCIIVHEMLHRTSKVNSIVLIVLIRDKLKPERIYGQKNNK
jgi:hypothetical protein